MTEELLVFSSGSKLWNKQGLRVKKKTHICQWWTLNWETLFLSQPGNFTSTPILLPGNYFLNSKRSVRSHSHELFSLHPVGQQLISTHLPTTVPALVKFLVYPDIWFGNVLVLKLNMGGEHPLESEGDLCTGWREKINTPSEISDCSEWQIRRLGKKNE